MRLQQHGGEKAALLVPVTGIVECEARLHQPTHRHFGPGHRCQLQVRHGADALQQLRALDGGRQGQVGQAPQQGRLVPLKGIPWNRGGFQQHRQVMCGHAGRLDQATHTGSQVQVQRWCVAQELGVCALQPGLQHPGRVIGVGGVFQPLPGQGTGRPQGQRAVQRAPLWRIEQPAGAGGQSQRQLAHRAIQRAQHGGHTVAIGLRPHGLQQLHGVAVLRSGRGRAGITHGTHLAPAAFAQRAREAKADVQHRVAAPLGGRQHVHHQIGLRRCAGSSDWCNRHCIVKQSQPLVHIALGLQALLFGHGGLALGRRQCAVGRPCHGLQRR